MSEACDATKGSCETTKSSCSEPVHNAGTECCDMPEKLLCLADEAWKEVVKDKIKQEIERTAGAKLDALAKLVAETNHKRWAHLIEGKQKCNEFKEQVKEVMLSFSK
jgi:hypothetical protein